MNEESKKVFKRIEKYKAEHGVKSNDIGVLTILRMFEMDEYERFRVFKKVYKEGDNK